VVEDPRLQIDSGSRRCSVLSSSRTPTGKILSGRSSKEETGEIADRIGQVDAIKKIENFAPQLKCPPL
jgi:hypothetical protein